MIWKFQVTGSQYWRVFIYYISRFREGSCIESTALKTLHVLNREFLGVIIGPISHQQVCGNFIYSISWFCDCSYIISAGFVIVHILYQQVLGVFIHFISNFVTCSYITSADWGVLKYYIRWLQKLGIVCLVTLISFFC